MARFRVDMSEGFKEDYKAKPPEVRKELNDVLRFLEQAGPQHQSLNSHSHCCSHHGPLLIVS